MKPDPRFIPLNQILHDVSLTIVAHEGEEVAPDYERVRQYLRMQEDFSFSDCLLVWENENRYYAANNYELLISLRQFYHDNSSEEILCIVISGATKMEIIEYSHRVTLLAAMESGNKKTKPQNRRLLTLRSFIEANRDLIRVQPAVIYEDVKRFFNLIGKSRTPAGEQLRKDFYLARNDILMCGLLGLESLSEGNFKPDLTKAIYTYETCVNKLIPEFNLSDESDTTSQARLAQFDKEHREYCRNVASQGTLKKNLVKPVYKRPEFSQKVFLEILEKCSGKKTKVAKSITSNWLIESTDDEIIIGNHKVHRRKNERENIKRHVEGAYKSFIYGRAERSFLKRAGPANHGQEMRSEDSINKLEFDSFDYFEFIRRYKVLYYCDPVLLLKVIKLRPSWFGFEFGSPENETAYSVAFSKFSDFYQKRFVAMAERKGFLVVKHKLYEIYHSIRTFLELGVAREDKVTFDDFMLALFTFVFSRLDDLEDVKNRELQAIRLALGDADLGERKKALESLLASRWGIEVYSPDDHHFEDFGFGSPVKGSDGNEDGEFH